LIMGKVIDNKSFFCTFGSGCTGLCLKLVMCYEILN
jgi:hypothetical protein